MLPQDDVPAPTENQAIVRAREPRGSNIFQVEYPNGLQTLVLLPARFQRRLWVRKGGYVIIEKSEEAEIEGSKITGTISAVLFPEHVRELKKQPGVWPSEFEDSSQAQDVLQSGSGAPQPSNSDGEEDGLPPLEPNTNRKVVYYSGPTPIQTDRFHGRTAELAQQLWASRRGVFATCLAPGALLPEFLGRQLSGADSRDAQQIGPISLCQGLSFDNGGRQGGIFPKPKGRRSPRGSS
eukprot:CAMPEP_0177608164 /NCGR_PEP_ID=MMETSP0419_2-20121207/18317_1 /TAXON_ID=582737 /ORGANISM="Tetraselmis sp., Strain GSL018" /LENGTH=236 /DNA_ID=CAMNT_0019102819 /DNA_START=118 /DNA_END=825 /DNA_ORIENTATION=-